MVKVNLIRLGAICQQRFNMRGDFKIYEIPPDHKNMTYKVNVPIPKDYDIFSRSNREWWEGVRTEEITLEKVLITENIEYIRVGYGKNSNTLIIQEIE